MASIVPGSRLHSCAALLLASWLAMPAHGDTLPEVIARVRPGIVAVGSVHPLQTPTHRLAGTGFFVGDGSYVLTCHHVVQPLRTAKGGKLSVFVGTGRQARARRARVVAVDPERDAALLAVDGEPGVPLRLRPEGTVAEGQPVAFTGFPVAMVYGLHPVTHRGIVSSVAPIAIPQLSARTLDGEMLRRLHDRLVVYQLDATAYPGNSGSPVYDPANGDVLGIVSSVFVKRSKEKLLQDPSGITFVIPIRWGQALLTSAEASAAER